MSQAQQPETNLADWAPHLALGITGHRETNPTFAKHRAEVARTLAEVFDLLNSITAAQSGAAGTVRLHNLLADGVDQIAAHLAFERGWQVVAPLPFGRDLNCAINARPATVEDFEALCAGAPASDPEVERRAANIRDIAAASHVFALSDRDAKIGQLFKATLENPNAADMVQAFDALCSDSVTNAGQVMIERIDLLIAVWDQESTHHRGGTGHTVATALSLGTPVLVMDPSAPGDWRVYSRPEELGSASPDRDGRLQAIVAAAMSHDADELEQFRSFGHEIRSHRLFGFYRQIENWFGKSPKGGQGGPTPRADITDTSTAGLIDAVAQTGPVDEEMIARLRTRLVSTFDGMDAISTALSDAYRSSMCYNFVLAALAVIAGLLYLPFKLDAAKWAFAAVELALLGGIIAITVIGKRRGWHRRWFETRRAAEYLRHSPAMLLLGVSRPIGRWPRGTENEWPEQYARHLLRNIGLPQISLDRDYLRLVITRAITPHVTSQRDYHRYKAERLSRVHHGLDKAAQACFFLAVLAVTAYLGLKLGAIVSLVPETWPAATSKAFTFLGVAFPTLGANLAGIRFFGDFERFAGISRVAAARLDEIAARLDLLLSGDPDQLSYRATADLVQELDEAVIEEIAGWQSVFGAKHLDLPA